MEYTHVAVKLPRKLPEYRIPSDEASSLKCYRVVSHFWGMSKKGANLSYVTTTYIHVEVHIDMQDCQTRCAKSVHTIYISRGTKHVNYGHDRYE